MARGTGTARAECAKACWTVHTVQPARRGSRGGKPSQALAFGGTFFFGFHFFVFLLETRHRSRLHKIRTSHTLTNVHFFLSPPPTRCCWSDGTMAPYNWYWDWGLKADCGYHAPSVSCPANTYPYHKGSHCCRVNKNKQGGLIQYEDTGCHGNNFIECPAGAIDGACKNGHQGGKRPHGHPFTGTCVWGCCNHDGTMRAN